jgi:hypothetical protein
MADQPKALPVMVKSAAEKGCSPVAATKTGVKVHIPKRPIAGIGPIMPPEH